MSPLRLGESDLTPFLVPHIQTATVSLFAWTFDGSNLQVSEAL